MYRKIISFLEVWKEDEHRKPLILQGARQVGKTYSILEFGRTHYENVAYFNFETNPKLNETFEEDISPDYLIPILSHIAGQTIVKEKTLIVFDEVQLCERALTSLKYFCEDAPEYHIIVAGSLLGVAVNRAKFSFPVGKVDMKTLYPMDMEEFMLALGEDDLVAQIKESFNTNAPLPSALHDAAMQLYRQYLVVGGMPECVMQFVETRDYILVRHTQDMLSSSLQKTLAVMAIRKSCLFMPHSASEKHIVKRSWMPAPFFLFPLQSRIPCCETFWLRCGMWHVACCIPPKSSFFVSCFL